LQKKKKKKNSNKEVADHYPQSSGEAMIERLANVDYAHFDKHSK
jgi:hypothetical protein